ncbi:Domain of uncharacterised function (DUF404) [Klebsiella pneumoniae subsp. ozaenae]|uniref:Domain of uncharacterized function (DUF404) n=1 Tax=Klebsiella pneumoniae subsp. ozaenae TaxID=574 RepID=A0A377ZH80_KLEPO|nr:Domain of uncharacterised function (DUF404) [Klebsiella pneumoniae subsp. ozaenae]
MKALNAFLYDIYHEQNILRAGLIPAEQVLANEQYQPCMQGINLPNNTYAHITGVDMVRNNDVSTTCWRIICARRPASPTCSKTVR